MRARQISDQCALTRARYCHCGMCRKAQGSAFRARASAKAAEFEWLQGEDAVTFYESSPGNYRGLCSVCGSHVVSKFDGVLYVGVPLGPLDDDPGVRTIAIRRADPNMVSWSTAGLMSRSAATTAMSPSSAMNDQPVSLMSSATHQHRSRLSIQTSRSCLRPSYRFFHPPRLPGAPPVERGAGPNSGPESREFSGWMIRLVSPNGFGGSARLGR